MTINDYLQNPYGKGSAYLGGNVKQMTRKAMTEYTSMKTRFIHKIYIYRNNAIIHVVMPSKNNPNVTYDVVFEFKLNDLPPEAVDVGNLPFTVFSNCPSFIFTYSNAFREAKLSCSWLDSKASKTARTTPASVRNPYKVIGYEKSLFLACLYLKMNGIMRLDVIKSTATKVQSYKRIADTIRTHDDIMSSVRSKVRQDPSQVPTSTSKNTFYTKKKQYSINERKSAETTKGTLFTKRTTESKSIKSTRTTKSTKKI